MKIAFYLGEEVGLSWFAPQFGDEDIADLHGRAVATRGFIEALISQPSEVDGVELILESPNPVYADTLLRFVSGSVIPVRLRTIDSLDSEPLEAAIIHNPAAHDVGKLAYVGRRWAPRLRAITTQVHGLGGVDLAYELGVRLAFETQGTPVLVFCQTPNTAAIYEAIEQELRPLAPLSGRRSTAVIPLGSPPQTFLPSPEAKATLGLEGDILVTYIGRMNPSTKGDLLPIVGCAQELCKEYGGRVRFVFAGADNIGYAQFLQTFTTDAGSVTFMPNLSRERKRALLSATDVFLSCVDTMLESFGLSIIEAFQRGIPCVVSDWDGYRDLVSDGITGFRIPTLTSVYPRLLGVPHVVLPAAVSLFRRAQTVVVDLLQLKEKLRLLIDNVDLRQAIGKQARREYEQQYSWETVVPRYVAAWGRLCQGEHGDVLHGPRTQDLGTPLDMTHIMPLYGTHEVGDDWFVEWVSERDDEWTQQILAVAPVYGEIAGCIDQATIERVYARIREGTQECGALTIRRVLADLDGKIRESQLYAVMWLAKHGLVVLHAPGGTTGRNREWRT